MSYYPQNCGCDCSGTQVSLPGCPYPDPGILSSPRYIGVYDYRFQPGRTGTPAQNSFVTIQLDGSGNPTVLVSNSPSILPPTYALPISTKFTGLLAAIGTAGQLRSLAPSAAGFLTANADGTWQISPTPASTVPDPLNIGTINATNLNSSALTISGLPTFSGLAAGTVTQQIGLNASNQLVTGSTVVQGAAQYYESISLTSVATPNATVVLNQPVVIGNEIYDPNEIAHVQDGQTIVIDIAGQYSVRWGGTYAARGSSLKTGSLYLAYNSVGNVVSNGYGNNGAQNTNSAYNAGGEWLQTLAAGDKLYVIAGGSPNTTAGQSGLSNVGLILERIR